MVITKHGACPCDHYRDDMRMLVTGGTGQLGQAMVREAERHGDTVLAAGSSELNLANREQVLQVVGAFRPEAIIHGGAWTDVDGCELDSRRAFLINAWGSRVVAEAAELVGARVVGVSTDYVFDGNGGGPAGGEAYTEWDQPDPLNVYGRSKLAGERELLERLGGSACVVRTAWVCGPDGKNFLKTMLRLADEGAAEAKAVSVVNDQHGSPTFTDDLARVLRELAVRRVSGVFHASNQGPTTWWEFAAEIFRIAGHDPGRVLPVSTAELLPARPAARPAFSLLDSVARDALGLASMPDWRASLKTALTALGRSDHA
jgi:dTDP-4-dehydrorhamnose reductase